ncbi:MAG: RDD family protein [Actinomycetota bacterium]|nr:RDD family protein [Actinomycetota bacterium]
MESIRGMGQVWRGETSGDPTAVVARRMIASLLDAVLISVVVLIVYRDGIATFTDDNTIIWNQSALLAASVLFIVNHVFLAGTRGFSLGKAIVGLRIVRRSDGGLPGLLGAAGRTVPWIIPFPVIPVLELGVMITTKGHRRIGDRIGRTLVVDRGDAGVVLAVPGLPDPPGPPVMPEQINPIEG